MPNIPFSAYDFFGHLTAGVVALVTISLVLGAPVVIGNTVTTLEGVILLLAAYALGQILAAPSKLILEDWVARWLLGKPSDNLMQPVAPKGWRWLFRAYNKPMAAEARGRLAVKAKSADGMRLTGDDLFFCLRYNPTVLADDRLQARLATFLNQYGFHRNLAFTCLISGLVLLCPGPQSPVDGGGALPIGLMIAAVVLFFRFLRFYRFYCQELFLTVAHNPSIPAI